MIIYIYLRHGFEVNVNISLTKEKSHCPQTTHEKKVLGVTQLCYERKLKILAFYVLTCTTQYNYCTYIDLDNIYGGNVIYLQNRH